MSMLKLFWIVSTWKLDKQLQNDNIISFISLKWSVVTSSEVIIDLIDTSNIAIVIVVISFTVDGCIHI